MTGTSAIDGTGNSLNNTIHGNAANNTLDDGKGDDTLIGGAGADNMSGGIGNNIVLYTNSSVAVKTPVSLLTSTWLPTSILVVTHKATH